MGILNALTKAGCDHDWGYWQRYDVKTNDASTLKSFFVHPERLRSCYEVRRCSKCKGYETRWVHDWRYDQNSVQAQRDWSSRRVSSEHQGPAIMMECANCGKREPEFVVRGD